MEESDVDLLFLSILLLLTLILCTSLRLTALYIPKIGFKRKIDVATSFPEKIPGRAIIQSRPSTSTSLGATLFKEDESISPWNHASHYPSPGFLGVDGSMKPRATFLETVATRTFSVSAGIISKSQTVRYFSEKIIFSKLSIDLGAATDPEQIPQPPENLCFNFVDCRHQNRLLRGLAHAASGISSSPRFNYWSRNSETHQINFVTSGYVNGDLNAYTTKKLYPYDHYTEVGVEDEDGKGAIDSHSMKHNA